MGSHLRKPLGSAWIRLCPFKSIPILVRTIFYHKNAVQQLPASLASGFIMASAKWRRGKDKLRHFSPCLICMGLLEAIEPLLWFSLYITAAPQTFSGATPNLGSQNLGFHAFLFHLFPYSKGDSSSLMVACT